MSLFDDLGEGLGLLSLHDRIARIDTLQLHHLDDTDAMEIDAMEIDTEVEEPNDTVEPEIDGESDTESIHETLFMTMLSPTALGAQYALKSTKLLMPPPDDDSYRPDPQGQNSHSQISHSRDFSRRTSVNSDRNGLDYEFDTSALNTLFRNQPDRTTFRTVAPAQVFGSTFDTTLNMLVEEPLWENSMNRSFQYRRQMAPASYLVVHHHHYYAQSYTPHQDEKTQSTLQNSQSVQSGFQKSESIVRRRPSHTRTQNSNPNTEVALAKNVLPVPWDPHAVPAERTPYLLSSYLQVTANVAVWLYAGYLVISVVSAIRQDVAYKLEKQAANLLVEIALCERSYKENNCDPELIVPALEKMCAYWEKCMNQDPFAHGNASLVSAHTIATIVNLLVEPLSFKVLFVFAATLMLVFAGNFAFGYIRAKTYYGWGAEP